MGLFRSSLEILAEFVNRCEQKDSILQVGVTSLFVPPKDIVEILQKMNLVSITDVGLQWKNNSKKIEEINKNKRLIFDSKLDQGKFVRPEFVYHALGFSEVDSVDIASHDDPTFLYDMNQPGAADSIGKQYDVVLEVGTIEHVFHVPNALWNLVSLCNVGGEIIHWAPMNNWPNHGYYQLQPPLFFDFYQRNGFEVTEAKIIRALNDAERSHVARDYAYERSFRSPIPQDGHKYLFLCRAKKREQRDSMSMPFQGAYEDQPGWRPGV